MLTIPGEFKCFELSSNEGLVGTIIARHPLELSPLMEKLRLLCTGVENAPIAICLYHVYVRPQFRNLGCGKKLVTNFIIWAKNEGYESIFLQVLPEEKIDRIRLIQFYENLGFKRELVPFISGDYMTLSI